MTKKLSGMKNPINKGGLRHVLGVFVVLLLVSALLIGAASADAAYYVNVTQAGNGDGSTPENASTLTDVLTKLSTADTGTYTIHLMEGTYADKYTINRTKTAVNITLQPVEGASVTFTDNITVYNDGAALTPLTDETLTFKNISFIVQDKTSAYAISATKHATNPSQSGNAGNIIVENCTFTGTNGITHYAIHSVSGSQAGNLTVINSAFTNISHPINGYFGSAQAITISGCTITGATEGINLQNVGGEHNIGGVTIAENSVTASLLAVRFGSTGKHIPAIIIRDNTLEITSASGAGAVIFRGNTIGSIVMSDNILKGTILIQNISVPITSFDAKENYFEGGAPTAGDSRFVSVDISTLLPYYAKLTDDGEIDKNSLTAPLTKGFAIDDVVTWSGESNEIATILKEGYYTTEDTFTLSSNTVEGVIINDDNISDATISFEGTTSIKNQTSGQINATIDADDNFGRVISWTKVDANDNISTLGSNADRVTFTAQKTGTATIKAEIAGGVYKEIAVTVFGDTEAKTDAKIETIDEKGNVTISTTSGNDELVLEDGTVIDSSTSKTVDAGKSVTLATESGVNVSLTYGEGATITSGEVKGKVTEIEATYPQTTAASENVEGVVSYGLVLTLKTEALNGSLILPTISPEFNETVSKKIDTTLYTALTMITATANVGEINGNLTDGGIELTFIIPQKAVTEKGKIRVLHVDGTNPPSEVSISTPTDDGKGNWIVKAQGDTFSSYVLTEYIYVAKDTTPSSSSSSGSSVWLTETPTETPTPTPTETVPTDTVPTDIPSTQPTEEPSSPGFGMLAVLAGLGTVAVLRRK